jgi:CO dehydrogenase maturation factor
MSFTIAIAGKGGVGKTTVAGLIVTRLIARGAAPVLAVDADPNTCLDQMLGLKVANTIGSVREEARQIAGKGLVSGVAKQRLLEMKIAESLVEADDFDLIAMGRPEGPGCYCYANNVLREAIQQVSDNYPYVVIDNEAGLENLSRRIVQAVDVLVMVADGSLQGLATIGRLHALATEMEIDYGRLVIVVNRLRGGRAVAGLDGIELLRASTEADPVVGLPEDEELANLAERGASLAGLSAGNLIIQRIDALLDAVNARPTPSRVAERRKK